MKRYLVAHDLGTTADKATLFSAEGELVRSVTASYQTYYGEHGAVEQDPREWWQVVCQTTRQLLQDVDKSEVAAISFGGQMMGCTCVDREGNALRRSIIWADTRSGEQAEQLAGRYDRSRFYHTTGFRLNPSYSITKLMWVKQYEPEVYRRTYKTLCCKDYIVLRLTGRFVTDHSDAAQTLTYDVSRRDWAYDIMEAAGVDAALFPQIVRADEVVGEVSGAAAAECGLAAGTPVVMGCGDGPAGRVGIGVVLPGQSFTCVGTSAWTSICAKEPVFDARERIFSGVNADPAYLTVSGTMQAAGASIAWMRDNLSQAEAVQAQRTGRSIYDFINANAAASPVGANGLLFLPYLMGERAPHWNAKARGAFIGLTMKHTAADMQRAVLEGVALNLGLIYYAERENGLTSHGVHKVIGGGANSPVLVQALADIYDSQVALTNMSDAATSLGAAILAGVGVGLFPHQNVSDRFNKVVATVDPIPANVARYRELRAVFSEAYEALVPVYPKLKR